MGAAPLRTAANYRLAHEWAMRNDFAYFVRFIFRARKGFSFQWSAHHEVICSALQAVAEGRISRLVINVPPRYGKSEVVAILFPAWCLGRTPDAEFILTSYSSRLAAGHAFAARNIVLHEAFRVAFPETRLRHDSTARDHWRTTAGGVMYSIGAGGTITGFGAGKMRPGFGGAVIIDDPLKPGDARSDVLRPKVVEWFQETLESRKNSTETPIVVIMQRLHEEDLSGWLLGGGNGEEWAHISLPALLEDGTALWPEKHTVEELLRLQRSAPYTFAGQYQQRPAPLEGGLFKVLGYETLDAVPSNVVRWVRAWDLGSSIDGDWTAGVLLGLQSFDWRENVFQAVVADVVRLRGGPEEVERTIRATAQADPRGTIVSLPQDPGQASKTQIKYLVGALVGHTVVWSPEMGDKFSRAEPVAAQMNVGNIKLLRGEWNREFRDELRNFPNAKHDDQVDALSRAFGELVNRTAKVRVVGKKPKPRPAEPEKPPQPAPQPTAPRRRTIEI